MNADDKSRLQPEIFRDTYVTDFYNELHDLSQLVESPQSIEGEPHFYTPMSDVWAISSIGFNLNFTQSVGMSEGFLKRLKFCFSTQVGLLSESTLISMLIVFKRQDFGFEPNNQEFQIDHNAVMAFIARLRDDTSIDENTKNQYFKSITRIASWSTQNLRLQDRLFTEGASELLRTSQFKKFASPQHDDPEKGRYDLPTFVLLQERVRSAWNQGVDSELTREEFILLLLLFAFGMRPIQLSQLKVSDLEVKETETGKVYTLNVPFAKQRKEAYRSQFEAFELENSLGNLIERCIVEGGLSSNMGLFQLIDSPAFNARKRATGVFKGHVTTAYVTSLVSSLKDRLNLPFATNAKRFRSTVGTKMYGALGPAWAGKILTHNHRSSINPYASLKIMANVVEGLTAAIHGDTLDLLNITNSFLENEDALKDVGAFQGMIVQRTHPKAPQLIESKVSVLPRGACGTVDGACTRKTVGLPYACYTCKSMMALSTGPHRAYLEHTLDLYLGLNKDGLHEQANQYLAPIFGMALVIQLINEQSHD